MAKKAAKKAAAKPATKPTATDASRRRESILFAAIANFCSKRVVRSDLVAGDEYRIESEIAGRIFRTEVTAKVDGILAVGHPTTYQANSAAKPEEVVAALLPLIPKTRRVELLKRLSTEYAQTGAMPVQKPDVDEARVWLSSLRSLRSAKRAGSVSFKLGG